MVYKDVTTNNSISPGAKGLYAYLASIAGSSDECYPTIDKIRYDMGITKDTFYKYMNVLIAAGVVKKTQIMVEGNRFGRNVYKLTHEVYISEKPFPTNSDTEYSITVKPDTGNNATTNNSSTNNIFKKNNNNTIVCSEPDKPTPNPSGILLPLNDKSFYDVPLDKIAMWKETYPAVDVKQELKRMIAWLDSNPTKRKTRRGINRFINMWLSKEQDKGHTYKNRDYDQKADVEAALAKHRYNGKVPDCPDGPFQ